MNGDEDKDKAWEKEGIKNIVSRKSTRCKIIIKPKRAK